MLPDLGQRVREAEWMDDPGLDPAEHRRALGGLARINRASLAGSRLLDEVKRVHRRGVAPVRILDLACGGGDVLHNVARRGGRLGIPVEGLGVDASPVALEFAPHHPSIRFQSLDVLRDPLPEGYHIVTSSLFLHHLPTLEAKGFLERASAVAEHSLLVQDLRRSRAGWLLALAGPRLLTTSPVVHVDARRSVRAAFTLGEARELCRSAGLGDALVRPCWPERFLIVWRRA